MKIRIKGNSIRLRLTKSEVETFAKTGYIEERTEFGNHLFMYALRKNPDVHELSAGFVGIKITMHVPTWMADEWTTTDEVGYSNVYMYDNGKQLSLLLEKDFVCLDAGSEDQSDNYENPSHACGPAAQVVEHVEAEPVSAHYELVDESLPAHIEEIAEPSFTPVPLNVDVDEEPTGEQCSVVDDLLLREESREQENWESVTTEQYPAAERSAHEAITEATMVADERTAAAEQYPAVEMPAHEAVTEAIMVADEPAAEPAAPVAEEHKTEEPTWRHYWETPAPIEEVVNKTEEHKIDNTEAALPMSEKANEEEAQHTHNEASTDAPITELVNEALEHRPWMQPEQEESPAAPVEPPTPPPVRKGPVRPPNWK